MDSQSLRSIIKSARDEMRKDAGTNTDVDRTPQITWMLFLKCFDDFEKKFEALDKNYKQTIPKGYRWKDWAEEEDEKGNKKKVLTGSDLIKFVNDELFPKLGSLVGGKGVEQRDIISSIFGEITNNIKSGFILRKILNQVSKVNFVSTDEIHILADYYEQMLTEMRDAAGSNGEFYTPRPVIRFIVNAINPDLKKSQKILDPACGTGGFMLESLNHMVKQVKTKQDRKKLYEDTIFGIEKKSMPFLLGMMNLLLHEVDRPNIINANTLGKPFQDITDENQYDVIITNPPFGGAEEAELKSNLPIGMQTTDTAMAFLLYIMYSLKDNGKCGIILPDGSPLSTSGIPAKIRQKLMEECNLHTIIRLPKTVFEPYTTIATNILFFDKKGTTQDIWYYKMDVDERLRGVTRAKNPKYTMSNPILYEDFEEVEEWLKDKKENDHAWKVSVDDLKNYSLEQKNPSDVEETVELSPHKIIDSILEDEEKMMKLLREVKDLIKKEIPD
jgi:type I restriction enzyme M protein